MNKYDSIFNEKLGELIKGIEFPWGDYSPQFLQELVATALPHHTEITLECSLAEYSIVAAWASGAPTAPAFMPTVHIALTAAESMNPKSLSMSPAQYVDTKEGINGIRAIWNETAGPHIKEAQEHAARIAKRDQREAEAKSKLVRVK